MALDLTEQWRGRDPLLILSASPLDVR